MADEDVWPDNTPDPEVPPKDNLKELREAAKRGTEAAAKVTELERKLAFAEAGIDTKSKLGQLVVKGYDGELTAEAIQAFYAEASGAPPEPTTEPDLTAEADAARTRNALANGAVVPSTESTPDPYDQSRVALKAAMDRGLGRDDARADAFRVLREAAEKGDPRVMSGTNHP